MSPSPELIWEGKYDKAGNKVGPVGVALPFQTVETINESSTDRQRSLDLFTSGRDPQWRNRLIWGDKKYVLPALMAEFQGKVDLIYIDPPFATGDDFSYTAVVPHPAGKSGGAATSFDKQPSLIEQKAYRDTWGRGLDGYIHWFSQTAIVLAELLSPTGSLYVHCDYRVDSYVRAVLDEVLGPANLRNVIRWIRSLPHNDPKQYGRSSDTILFYAKSDKWTFHPPFTPQKEDSVEAHYKVDESGRRFRLASLLAPGGRGPSYSYKGFVRNWRFTEDKMLELEAEGRVFFKEGQMPSRIYYLDESLGAQVQDVWTDISPLNPMATERTGYPTQKPESLLERIVLTSSSEGDLVYDCFVGSGTTLAVAERLSRRWIGSDLGRFAIHTTRKRLLSTPNVRPFVIQNLGKYERQHWQAAEFRGDQDARQKRYRDFILKMYGATSVQGYSWLHGTRAGRMVHVGAVDAPVSPGDVTQMVTELRRVAGADAKAAAIDVLGWDFAFELNEVAKQQSSAANIRMRFYKIPLDVMDSRAVEQGDVKFFELAALAVTSTTKRREANIALTDFVIPADDVPADIQKSIKDWSQWIDYWAIDWDNRTDTFHNEWQTYRTKDGPKLERSASHTYAAAGRYRVVVKVIDILGNDTTKILELEVK